MLCVWPSFFQKLSTVHKTLCKLSLEGDHSTTPSVCGSVKAYTDNFNVERYTLNLEKAVKTKWKDEVTTINILTNHSNVQRQDTAFAYQPYNPCPVWCFCTKSLFERPGKWLRAPSSRSSAQELNRNCRRLTDCNRRHKGPLWRRA